MLLMVPERARGINPRACLNEPQPADPDGAVSFSQEELTGAPGDGCHPLHVLWMDDPKRNGVGESNLGPWVCKYGCDKHLGASGRGAWRPAWRCSAATRISPLSRGRGLGFPRPENAAFSKSWMKVAASE